MAIVASGQLTITDLSDARQLVMYIGASRSRTVIVSGSTFVPNYGTENQVLTPQLYIAGTNADVAQSAISTKWYYQANGSGTLTEITANGTDYTLTTIGSAGLKSLTIKTNILQSNTSTSMTYICELTYPDSQTGLSIVTKSEIELVKVVNGNNGSNGTNAIIGVLSNESVTLPASSAGVVSSYAGATTTMSVYSGTTDDSANWLYTQAVSTGGTLSSTTPTVGSVANRTATVTAITNAVDSVTVTITATRTNPSATIVKTFTVTKAKAGAGGANATAYSLISPSVVAKSSTGVYTPSSITVSLQSSTGTSAPTAYSGKFAIADTTDGTNWTSQYISSSAEASKSYTPRAGITQIRVRGYLASATPTLASTDHIDEQIIPIVVDGVDAVYAYVWTPSGNTIKNGSGNVQVHVDIYKGATSVAGTAFKWYEQDPTATVASGGDADGGAGWRLLTSTYNNGITGYTTDTITVPSGAVAGQEAYKCVATYNGVKYAGVTMVVDVSDPILVRIDGVNVFKNGTGSTSLKAILLQAGAEIDTAGTQYNYSWSIYSKEGVKSSFTATGKTITVNASHITGVGNVICDVTTK